MAARKEWDLKPVADRAQIFLKAADMLSGPRRAEVLAKTMVGQVRYPWARLGWGGRLSSSVRYSSHWLGCFWEPGWPRAVFQSQSHLRSPQSGLSDTSSRSLQAYKPPRSLSLSLTVPSQVLCPALRALCFRPMSSSPAARPMRSPVWI